MACQVRIRRDEGGSRRNEVVRCRLPSAPQRLTTHFYCTMRENDMYTRTVLTFGTALVIGGALITGSAFGRAEEKNMSDSWITAKTKIALFADSRVKGSDISVATTDGKVIIRGKADTEAAKKAAEDIATGIQGAKTVK